MPDASARPKLNDGTPRPYRPARPLHGTRGPRDPARSAEASLFPPGGRRAASGSPSSAAVRSVRRQCQAPAQASRGPLLEGYGDGTSHTGISLLPDAARESEAFLEQHPETLKRSERVRSLIDGFESPYGLELLSTHWAATREGAEDADHATEQVQAWSPRKERLFRPTTSNWPGSAWLTAVGSRQHGRQSRSDDQPRTGPGAAAGAALGRDVNVRVCQSPASYAPSWASRASTRSRVSAASGLSESL